VAAFRRTRPAQVGPGRPAAAEEHRLAAPAALAVIAAFAVHSAFDFLWHIAVVPLLLVLSVVTLLPAADRPSVRTPSEVSS